MIADYKGVRIEKQNGWLRHVCRAHYDHKRKVILLREGLSQETEAKVLEHEYTHHTFGERHRWLAKLCLNDDVFLMATLTSFVWRSPLFMLVAVPFLVHEIQVEAKTTRNMKALVVYSLLLFAILSSSMISLLPIKTTDALF